MSAEHRPVHSPLGASSAERWMNCPGSNVLLQTLSLPESDEPDYRREGTAMHLAAAHCLENDLDTWEITGQTWNKTVLNDEMARHVQTYLDVVRRYFRDPLYVRHFIEFGISSPVHPLFYGTLDFGAVMVNRIIVRDLKGGEGIIVEPEENPQLMYYAYGLIEDLAKTALIGDDFPVDIGIIQPRAFHVDGPVRSWVTTAGFIRTWVRDKLVPAMLNAEFDLTLDAGPWCRFCPAKLVCPLLTSLFRAAATANPKEIVNISDESLGRSYQYKQAVTFYLKAMDEETYRRLNTGHTVPGTKLVPKKANRVWRPEAAAEGKTKFGPDFLTKPEPKSPAQLEALSPAAAEWVHEHAYTPNTGLTVALDADNRPAVVIRSTSDTFGAAIAALDTGAKDG